jgi:hypothetical protein
VYNPGDFTVEYVTADGYTNRIKPEELGLKFADFLQRFLYGFGQVEVPESTALKVGDVTIGLALTAEASLRIVSSSATASIQLRLTPKE